jgi:hypothetical protein
LRASFENLGARGGPCGSDFQREQNSEFISPFCQKFGKGGNLAKPAKPALLKKLISPLKQIACLHQTVDLELAGIARRDWSG